MLLSAPLPQGATTAAWAWARGRSPPARGPPPGRCRTPSLPTEIIPAKICWLKLSGKSPMDMKIPPLTIKIMPESTKRATSLDLQLPCLQQDLRTGSIPLDIVNFPSELCRRRSASPKSQVWCRLGMPAPSWHQTDRGQERRSVHLTRRRAAQHHITPYHTALNHTVHKIPCH